MNEDNILKSQERQGVRGEEKGRKTLKMQQRLIMNGKVKLKINSLIAQYTKKISVDTEFSKIIDKVCRNILPCILQSEFLVDFWLSLLK